MQGINAVLPANPTVGLALVPMRSAQQLEEDAKAASDELQQQEHIQALAAHVRERWQVAKQAKIDVEQRMEDNLRRRRGEYSQAKQAEIKAQGGSEIFLGVTSTKCRAASSWLRDTLTGTGIDRPWELNSTPIPDVPPQVMAQLQQALQQRLMQAYERGQQIPPEQIAQAASQMRDAALNALRHQAKERIERMEMKMEDQLVEGGWLEALAQVIDDIVVFPSAVIKGPVVRMRKALQWDQSGQSLIPVEKLRLEWERVDPFMLYPAPWADNPNDGFLIERHRMTREDLQTLIGVDGYDENAINTVLADFDAGGLREWLAVDVSKAAAEGKDPIAANSQDLVDALQLWDNVPGKDLLDWGLTEEDVPDPFRSYPCEVWLIGTTVIRAALNYDPLGEKPYFATSYEKVPGAFWGNSVVDLVKSPQDMINAAARALSNNMGIASGPQAYVNVQRLPAGEEITQMFPWKIWQIINGEIGDTTRPIDFFQPNSNAAELLEVINRYTDMADEFSGIPKYMSGEHVPGAGRTSSGLAMLINNASKALKAVVANIDNDIINRVLDRLYSHNQRYRPDPDLIGDVNIVARGAMSLVSREAAAVRRNEFLTTVLTNPMAQEIVGMPGAAELLRENARLLDMNTDRIVPSHDQIMEQMRAQQMMMQQQQAALMQQGAGPGGAPTQPDGSRMGGRDANFVSPRPNGA